MSHDEPTINTLLDPAAHAGITLWHVTSSVAADAIEANGLRAMSYWTCDERLADYYAETVRDEGSDPVVFRTSLAALPLGAIEPDLPGYDEPITCVVGSEDAAREVYRTMEQKTGSAWIASLVALRSLRCRAPLPAEVLTRLPSTVHVSCRP